MRRCSQWRAVSLLLALAMANSIFVRADDFLYFQGDMTTYTLGSTSSGNCNFMTAPPDASHNYAAINAEQWESTKSCGRCAEVSCADARCSDTSQTALVHILDQCPECKQGDLDVSPTVFKTLTGSDPSRYKIKWRFVDCPLAGNLKYCLKEGSNPYYTAIQPANGIVGVKSMTINAKATGMVTSAYYYLLEGANLDLSAVEVSVTAESGEVITETVALTAGSCTDGASQFAASASASTAPAATPEVTAAETPAPTVAPSTPEPEPETESPLPPAPTEVTPETPAPTTASPPRTTAPVATPAPVVPFSSPPPATSKPVKTKRKKRACRVRGSNL